VRANRIVVLAPLLDQHLCFLQRVKDLSVEQLVAQLAVEALVLAIFPQGAWFDEQRLHPDAG
jgi:hypothetical protein